MSTKIDLAYPYNEDFKQGYLNTNKESRKIVALVRKDNTKTSTSYARYLISCHLGRYLKKSEHVDHVDNDHTNDTLSNLQILTPLQNNLKRGIKITYIDLLCPICNKSFRREKRQVQNKINRGKKPTCSRVCGGKKSVQGLV